MVWWWSALAQGHCCKDGTGPGHGYACAVGAAALMVAGSDDGGAVAQVARARQRELRLLGRGKR